MRLSTGVDGFDDVIEGGYLQERVYLVAGPPGSGKTTFGVQFLADGVDRGENGLFVSLVENPIHIIKDMSRYSMNVVRKIKENRLFFMDMGPLSFKEKRKMNSTSDAVLNVETLLSKLEGVISSKNIKRLVIDSTMTIRYQADEDRNKDMVTFFRSLKDFGTTTLILSELTEPDAYSTEHFLSHGVIFMHNFLAQGRMHRALQVVKMRGTIHDCNMRQIVFTKNGLSLSSEQDRSEG